MRFRRRYPAITRTDKPLDDKLLGLMGYCQRHARRYRLNVVNNGRIECGRCPECHPPKPPAEPEESNQ